MSKAIKPSAFFFTAALAGLMAVYAPSTWSDENHQQHSQHATEPKADAQGKHAEGMNHQGMDHGAMKGMNHDAMKGMDHGSMQGMDHSKMMESQGGDNAKAGKDGQ